MNTELDISIIEEQFERRTQRFLNLKSKEYSFKNCKFFIWEYYQIKGWYEALVKENIKESKQAFFDAAKTEMSIWLGLAVVYLMFVFRLGAPNRSA